VKRLFYFLYTLLYCFSLSGIKCSHLNCLFRILPLGKKCLYNSVPSAVLNGNQDEVVQRAKVSGTSPSASVVYLTKSSVSQYMYLWLYSHSVGPLPLFQFLNPVHSWYDSLDGGSAGRKAVTYTQNITNTEKTYTDIHASSGILTHDPSVWAGGHCDRHLNTCIHRRRNI
jgi:hypothetical protein